MSNDTVAWTNAHLSLVRARLQCAVEQRDEWPSELLAAEAKVEAAISALGDALPHNWLASRLGLTVTERRVLWMLVAHELCPLARSLLRSLTTETLSDPTTGALRRAAYGNDDASAAWRELAADGGLRRLRLIERTDTGADVPEHRQTWRISSRLIALLHGDVGPDPELDEICASLPPSAEGIGDGGIEVDDTSATALRAAITAVVQRGTGLVIVQGKQGTGRRSLVASIARAQDLQLFVIEARALAKDRAQLQRQLRAIVRECRLLRVVPLIRELDALAPTPELDALEHVERELRGVPVLATSSRAIARRWSQPPRTIELHALTGTQRVRLWSRALPMVCASDAQYLATMYPIAPALMASAAKIMLEQAGDGKLTADHIGGGLRAVLDDRLAGLATRVTVRQSWDDLVLPEEQHTTMLELLARIRERRMVYEDWGFAAKVGRGMGVSALFSGPPGTGKTMAAGLIARDLGTELYQVDVSKITSKWIGETEKNLAALFDAAEAGQAILLFDEADALFGKRTDVKSSNDRHANQETNFLLQRLESFSGICILTTNHEDAIDEAFRRRLAMHVQFPMPEIEERARLWRALIPQTAPVDPSVDFDELAEKYEMSGGYIRNAVLRAAFHAADGRTSIGHEHVARAAQLEYQAMGRVIALTH